MGWDVLQKLACAKKNMKIDPLALACAMALLLQVSGTKKTIRAKPFLSVALQSE
jgi:hypothetical protein